MVSLGGLWRVWGESGEGMGMRRWGVGEIGRGGGGLQGRESWEVVMSGISGGGGEGI